MSKPIIASNRPVAMDVEKGKKYFWCACGKSQTQPLCDGAHSATDVKPLVFEATETKTVYLCGCKQTGNAPYCDGSHQFEQGGGRDQYYDNNHA
jgi:CDGSH iron-sulfur domain-containing protein 3